MNAKTIASVTILASVLAMPAEAGCEIDVSDYVGWQIIYSGTVTGHIDDNGEKQSSFRGCRYGRKLIVDYSKQVTCTEYSYSYAYQPDIVVLSDGHSLQACIDDEMYDIRR